MGRFVYMINRFLDHIAIEKRYSPCTVKEYGDDLRAWCKFLGWEVEDFDPSQLDADDVKEWMLEMLEQGQSPRSVKRRLSAIKSLYRFLLSIGLVKVNITRMVIMPKTDKPLPIYFRESEMEAFKAQNEVPSYDEGMDKEDWLEAMRDYLLIEILYQTGMRRAELAALEDKDVDIEGRQIRVFGKRRKERIVPMGEQLVRHVKEYLQIKHEIAKNVDGFGTFLVRKNRKGEWVPLGDTALYNIVRARMNKVTTLKKHSPHVLRHTFATTMLNNGADIRTIQTLLGHSSLEATQVYTHTTFEQVKQAYNKAHPRGNGEGRENKNRE